MQSFEVPGRFPSLNDYLRIRNSRQRAALKRALDHRVAWAAKEARIRPVKCCTVRIVWFEQNHRRDLDNVSFAKKFVLDGLVKAGVFPDDGPRHVIGTRDEYAYDKSNPRILVEIHEEGEPTWHKR